MTATDRPTVVVHRHGHHSDREASGVTAVLALLCALACIGAVVPGLDGIVNGLLAGALALAITSLAVRWGARWVRERREDRDDAITAAHWRVAHAPYLLTAADRALLTTVPANLRARAEVS